ncbi:uncharacterized protein LOC101847967 [Aplysia californica]|uniref:Uncharacterized protein LOC101847967 n=1 Tax=Aplysia californica TaxID=6500 RepID=A0ABM0JUB7_APLCA|nr:uncharacterized protein LOC101847967 [Aplysia californica]
MLGHHHEIVESPSKTVYTDYTDWNNKHPYPVWSTDLEKTPPKLHTVHIPGVQAWSVEESQMWAASQGLCSASHALGTLRADGRQLLRTDALKLQRFGVKEGKEALLAENKIRNIAFADKDQDRAHSWSFPASMHQALRKGELPCPSVCPLSMLATDPWSDNKVKSHWREQNLEHSVWFGYGDGTGANKRCLYW